MGGPFHGKRSTYDPERSMIREAEGWARELDKYSRKAPSGSTRHKKWKKQATAIRRQIAAMRVAKSLEAQRQAYKGARKIYDQSR